MGLVFVNLLPPIGARLHDPTSRHPLVAALLSTFHGFWQQQRDSRLYDGSLMTKIAQLFQITNKSSKIYTKFRPQGCIFYCIALLSYFWLDPKVPKGQARRKAAGSGRGAR